MTLPGELLMQSLLKKLAATMCLLNEPSGQDLIEYALVVSLIALGAVAGMNSVASGINTAFSNLANTLATAA